MDAFLAKVGSEFDSSFIKLHVGTDDLDELVELTWERSDLSPLVDAGLKPLLRNKLYRAISEERAARSKCVAATVETSSTCSTGMLGLASLCDENSEVPLSEIQDDASPSLCDENSEVPLSEIQDDASSSLCEDKSEVPLSETQDDASSSSQVSGAPTLQAASLADVCTSVDPGNDSSAASRSSPTSVPTSSKDVANLHFWALQEKDQPLHRHRFR
jgi:hypothetical protein